MCSLQGKSAARWTKVQLARQNCSSMQLILTGSRHFTRLSRSVHLRVRCLSPTRWTSGTSWVRLDLDQFVLRFAAACSQIKNTSRRTVAQLHLLCSATNNSQQVHTMHLLFEPCTANNSRLCFLRPKMAMMVVICCLFQAVAAVSYIAQVLACLQLCSASVCSA